MVLVVDREGNPGCTVLLFPPSLLSLSFSLQGSRGHVLCL